MTVRIVNADVLAGLAELPDESVHCVVTSPPYWGLRDYGVDGQIGLEATPAAFVARMVEVFREVRRVLRKDGTCWVNLGDSYANDGKWGGSSGGKHVEALHGNTGIGRGKTTTGLKPKDLIGIPWRVALALQDDGWWLRSDIIWSKPNPMPESVTDRPTKAHEYLFLLTKAERYHYDADAIKEKAAYPDGPNSPESIASPYGQGFTRNAPKVADGRKALHADTYSRHRSSIDGGQSLQSEPDGRRNKRSVWTIATAPFAEAHFATFPPELPEICIKAGCPVGGTVLDPFGGAGTTGLVADRLQRNAILIELNPEYAAMAERRINGDRGGLLDLMEAVA